MTTVGFSTLALVVPFVLLMSPTCLAAPKQEAIDAVQGAEVFYRDGHYEEAIVTYTEAIAADPHCYEAYVGRARAYRRLLLSALAEEDYVRAVQANPGSDEPLLACAKDRCLAKQYAEAILDLDAAVRLNPDHAELYHWRGFSHLRLDHFEQAVADFNELIKRNPTKQELRRLAFANRADAERRLGQAEAALADYERAKKEGATDTARGIARCQMLLKHWPEALAVYDQILDPTDASRAARGELRHQSLRMRAEVRARLGDFDGSESDIAEAIELEPDDAYAYGTASYTRLFAGDLAAAQAAALKGLELDGSQAWIRGNLACAYALQGHFDWARRLLRPQDIDEMSAEGKTGTQNLIEGIKELRAAGIDHPDMVRLEALIRDRPTPPPSSH